MPITVFPNLECLHLESQSLIMSDRIQFDEDCPPANPHVNDGQGQPSAPPYPISMSQGQGQQISRDDEVSRKLSFKKKPRFQFSIEEQQLQDRQALTYQIVY